LRNLESRKGTNALIALEVYKIHKVIIKLEGS